MMRPTEEDDFDRMLDGRRLDAGETDSRWSISEENAPARVLDGDGDGTRLLSVCDKYEPVKEQ